MAYTDIITLAKITGYALNPFQNPIFDNLNLTKYLYKEYEEHSANKLRKAIKITQPHIIFHLAMIECLKVIKPKDTINVNISGTANLLEASKSIRY